MQNPGDLDYKFPTSPSTASRIEAAAAAAAVQQQQQQQQQQQSQQAVQQQAAMANGMMPNPYLPYQMFPAAVAHGGIPAVPEDEPLYVNAKQYHRILKRRAARAKFDAELKAARAKKPYLHESRHKHAMRRPRGAGGRFLTAKEIAELEKNGQLPGQTNSSGDEQGTAGEKKAPATKKTVGSPSKSPKRKEVKSPQQSDELTFDFLQENGTE